MPLCPVSAPSYRNPMAHTRSAAARPVHSQGIRLKVLRLRRPSVRKGSGSVKKHCWILDRDRLAAAKPAYAGVRMWPRVKRSENPGTPRRASQPAERATEHRRSISLSPASRAACFLARIPGFSPRFTLGHILAPAPQARRKSETVLRPWVTFFTASHGCGTQHARHSN